MELSTADRAPGGTAGDGSAADVLAEAATLAANGDPDTALRLWQSVRERDPTQATAFVSAARVLRDCGRMDEAEALLSDARFRFPADFPVASEWAAIAQFRRDLPEALRRWDQARQQFPQRPEPHISGGAVLREVGRLDEADAVLSDTLRCFPDEAGAAIQYALVAHDRRDWPEALARWEQMRALIPGHPASYAEAGYVLREIGRLDDAEDILAEARRRFPDDLSAAMNYAIVARARGDRAEALHRWEQVRLRFPAFHAAYSEAGEILRQLGRDEEAESLLADACRQFPGDFGFAAQYASAAQARRDWTEALNRWESARMRFPHDARPYLACGRVLREMGQPDAADAVLTGARGQFPDDADIATEHALTVHYHRDWAEAARRWEYLRERFPDRAIGYTLGAETLLELKLADAAETLLAEAQRRFPDVPDVAMRYSAIARHRGDKAEAFRRSENTLTRFPNHAAAYVEGAIGLREAGRDGEAETLLLEARRRFPDNAGPVIELAFIAQDRSDWAAAVEGWEDVRRMAPYHPVGYVAASHALRATGRPDEAEALLGEATALLPNDLNAAVEFARIAHQRDDWAEAGQRWRHVTTRFPQAAEGPAGEADVFRHTGRPGEADAVIEAAMARLPGEPSLAEEYGLNAMALEDWPKALARLEEARRRFPRSLSIRQRHYQLQLRIADAGGEPAPAPVGSSEGVEEECALVMNFESLGGGGHGCEFGVFQRGLGAESLGLLRWADIYCDKLTDMLNAEFEGVGEPAHTDIFIPPHSGRPEYWTLDRRYYMAMRAFTLVEDVPPDRMARLVQQRMRFLRRKMIEDLQAGTKIFVYKNIMRTLTGEELDGLHSAVRRYGDNTLLYIAYQDAEHPNGTVEWRGSGLMVGYIDHFSHAPETDAFLGFAHSQFLGLCRTAYRMWNEGRAPEEITTAA
jgi:tetratricopeptide (TPR) repeat protein